MLIRGGDRMWHNVLASVLGIILLESLLIQPALGQGEYPTRPVEIIVQATPGSSSDYHSRLVAEISKKYLGQPFIVVNKPGAGGAVAAADLLQLQTGWL